MSTVVSAPAASPPLSQERPRRLELAFLPLHFVLVGLVVIACFMSVDLGLHERFDAHVPFATATGLAGIGLMLYSRYVLGRPWMSASTMYLFLIWVFHYGMTFTALLAPDVMNDVAPWDRDYLEKPTARIAMLLGTLAAAGFVFGNGFWRSGAAAGRTVEPDRSPDWGLFIGGWLLLAAGIALSYAIVLLNVGLSVFSIGYMGFLGLTDSTYLGVTMGLTHLGCLMAISGAVGRHWLKPFVLWVACIAIPILVLGTRSGAIISILGFGIVLTHRGVRFPKPLLAAAGLLILVVVPAVESFRMEGFANRAPNWTDVTPLDSFVELGGSLRATTAYVDWIEEGDPLQMGLTYVAPIDRQIVSRMMPWRERVPAEEDVRLPQRMMTVREGPIGGSATGEAYYNFGLIGPFVFCFCLGLLMGWLEGPRVASPAGCATLGIVMFVFFFHVRGDWLAVPATLAEGLLLVAACRFMGRMIATDSNKPAMTVPANQGG